MTHAPVVLVILDGWGVAPDGPGNAISAARTPNMDRYLSNYPATRLRCSGQDVGLPSGQMGNSEVGHLNIGAGYVVYQSITRIDKAIEDGSFSSNQTLRKAFEHAGNRGSRVHLIGLIGDGGVHAHHRHWKGLIDLAAEFGQRDLITHAIMDGRDTEPTSGIEFMRKLVTDLEIAGVGEVGSVSGRYYAMDRDRRWERTRHAWKTIVLGHGPKANDPVQAVTDSYSDDVTDEFIEPVSIVGVDSAIHDGDAVIFVNFRADRVRQMLTALTASDFSEFDRGSIPSDLYIATLTEYDPDFPVEVIFPPEFVETPLAKVVSDAGIPQYHTAETEKYAHVTYFINGGREEPFPGEDREMIPSPKVATYDLQPEMSASEVASTASQAIRSGRYGLVVINFANGDMVGHTGVFDAAVKAIETVDECAGLIVDATLEAGGVAIITADHGNAEEMLVPGTDDVWTAHTMNPVPLVIVVRDDHPTRNANMLDEGRLSDIAPTVLKLMNVDAPPAMTGRPLFHR